MIEWCGYVSDNTYGLGEELIHRQCLRVKGHPMPHVGLCGNSRWSEPVGPSVEDIESGRWPVVVMDTTDGVHLIRRMDGIDTEPLPPCR